MDNALADIFEETLYEFVERTPFTESDDEDYESMYKKLPKASRRRKLLARAKKHIKFLEEIKRREAIGMPTEHHTLEEALSLSN